MAMINREELAWAAGFFDGEGTTGCHRKHGRDNSTLRLAVAQAELAPLERFRRAALGVGKIVGPVKRPIGLPMWYYAECSFQGVQAVVAALWPFLGETKRAQATNAIKRWHAAPIARMKTRALKRQEV